METSRTSVTAISEENYLEKEGYPKHAIVCETHVGVGLTIADIEEKTISHTRKGHDANLYRGKNYMLCRQVFSKDNEPLKEKPTSKAREFIARFGDDKLKQFDEWLKLFKETE